MFIPIKESLSKSQKYLDISIKDLSDYMKRTGDERDKVEKFCDSVITVYGSLAMLQRSQSNLDGLSIQIKNEYNASKYLYRVRVQIGLREGQYDENYTSWAVFPKEMSDERIESYLTSLGWALEGYPCHTGDWDCCGRFFANSIFIERKGSRVLVTQSFGRDV